MLLALLPFALAGDPPRVGPGTGDHPLYRGTPDISCLYPPDVEVRRFYPEGPRRPRPRHARADFAADIAASARLALPVDRVEPTEPAEP